MIKYLLLIVTATGTTLEPVNIEDLYRLPQHAPIVYTQEEPQAVEVEEPEEQEEETESKQILTVSKVEETINSYGITYYTVYAIDNVTGIEECIADDMSPYIWEEKSFNEWSFILELGAQVEKTESPYTLRPAQ